MPVREVITDGDIGTHMKILCLNFTKIENATQRSGLEFENDLKYVNFYINNFLKTFSLTASLTLYNLCADPSITQEVNAWVEYYNIIA